MDVKVFLAGLMAGERPTDEGTEAAFTALLSGQLDDAQVGALLALLPPGRVEAGTLAAAARVMRRHVTPVPIEPGPGEVVIDTCGTGGAAKTFNISTAAALVAASAPVDPRVEGVSRVLVAKHGNRSRSGRGSAEVLGALGVNVDATPEVQARCLRECGVCFCFAIHHHPAMRHVAGPRRSLGIATVFNLLGPLTNPARAERQVIGVYAEGLVAVVGGALARLGARRAMVAHGDGMDELTTTGPNRVAQVGESRVVEGMVEPRGLGLGAASRGDLEARDVAHAAALVREAIEPGAKGPRAEVVRLNAAAALVVAGAARDLADGLDRARQSVDTGAAARTLAALVRVSTERTT